MHRDVRYSAKSQEGDAVMYRVYGISQGAREGGANMYRKYGISQGAREGGANMYRKYGISQRAMNGKERRIYNKYGQIFSPAISAFPPSMIFVYCRQPRISSLSLRDSVALRLFNHLSATIIITLHFKTHS